MHTESVNSHLETSVTKQKFEKHARLAQEIGHPSINALLSDDVKKALLALTVPPVLSDHYTIDPIDIHAAHGNEVHGLRYNLCPS